MSISRHIPFDYLGNTRDLGGMKTRDGRQIRAGKLIRSGHLHQMSPRDIRTIQDIVGLVVDFRTQRERKEKPDLVLEDVSCLHLPVFERLTAGISRDEGSDKEALAMLANDPPAAKQYMIRIYSDLVSDPFSVSQYGRFFRELLVPREKAVLWHCTAGKDRAGLAAAFVQELLGVAREDILADYLKTNEYLRREVEALSQMFLGRKIGALTEGARQSLGYLFGAHADYLTAAYQKIDERYGSFAGFAFEGLSLTEAEQNRLRQMYLV